MNTLNYFSLPLTPSFPPRNSHRPPWPFADLSNRLNPSGEVPDLASLVGRIVSVFNHMSTKPLKEGWAKIALQVRDAGFCRPSFSFQIIVCFHSSPGPHSHLSFDFLSFPNSGPLVVHHTNMLVSHSRLVEEHQLCELTIIVSVFSSPCLYPFPTGVSSPGTASQLPCVSGGAHTAGGNCL